MNPGEEDCCVTLCGEVTDVEELPAQLQQVIPGGLRLARAQAELPYVFSHTATIEVVVVEDCRIFVWDGVCVTRGWLTGEGMVMLYTDAPEGWWEIVKHAAAHAAEDLLSGYEDLQD